MNLKAQYEPSRSYDLGGYLWATGHSVGGRTHQLSDSYDFQSNHGTAHFAVSKVEAAFNAQLMMVPKKPDHHASTILF